ncbi:ATP-grasp domain-containing protein [Actinocrinis puniceicyclus]|uniref:ATP-grasp domain-containing protein n=1 Tax=Actinocrinis puniceicyclus TaxID=977794 RepID=A0A8J7WLY8_9ACTN|nr:ATP-grasp domain-containing protein [Actinocrinis puniceicyclus]MBS2961894.1 ATP-grasp domain-containing protein [Actinocrinis puniceicyclus]
MPEHLIVLHRWADRYANYGSYVDHGAHRVSYVTTRRAAGSLPEAPAAVRTVHSTEDGKEVRAAVSSLIEERGRPARVVALHEVDLDMAAELREELGVPGERLAGLAPFRDKLVMARRLAAAGVPVPATGPAPDHEAVRAFAAAHGWPVLVKPLRGTASAGVARLDSEADLAAYSFPPDLAMLVQPYLPHEVLHVDGVYHGTGLGAWRASRYLNTCLGFTAGAPLGSVELDDPRLLKAVGAFTAEVLRAVSDGPRVFHLELFRSGPDSAPELQVLEVGARPGGAEVPFVWREVHGIDLMEAAFALQIGAPLPAAARAAGEPPSVERGGWLLVPTPAARPCRVTAADPQVGTDGGPYAERVPLVGQTLDDLPGYEHAGARFRFRGASTAEVQAAVERTATAFEYRCTSIDESARGLVVLVGSGGRPYREYAFAAAAARADVALVTTAEPSWQQPYLAGCHRMPQDTPDATAAAAARACAAHPGRVGLLTWDEVLLEATAEAASRLGLPHMSLLAARNCRDKLSTRRLLAAAGVAGVKFAHVHGQQEALRAAESIGYPVVVKPRSLAGSAGVVVMHGPDELRALYHYAAEAVFPGIEPLDGLVLEEFLDGPEVSVDSVVRDREVQPVNVARKRLGFEPFFEEIGHLVSRWRHEPWADELTHLVVEAHRALGVTMGVTHAEVRLTAAGPRLVELNGRLGGDFIPHLGSLATGIDLTAAAVDLALGREPDLRQQRDVCAEVRFLYPDRDCVVRSLDTAAAAAVPGVAEVVRLAQPGARLLLPPRGVVPRLAALLVTGETPEECQVVLDRAAALVAVELEPAGHDGGTA